jgi:hypothetical protein
MTGTLSPPSRPTYPARALRRCRSPEIISRSVISIRAVSTNRSARMLGGGDCVYGHMLVVDDADARATVSAFADSLNLPS